MHAVLLAGGWAHPGNDLIAAMGEIFRDRSISLAVVTDPVDAAEALRGPCDLLVVGACWFAMLDDRYTPQQRSQHAVAIDQPLAAALEALHMRGCPLLAMHTAVICFDAHPVWTDWLGATWNWDTSWHPEPASIEIRAAATSPLPIESFSVVDELYQGLDLDVTIEPVAESAAGHPLVWLHESASSLAAVDLLGHDTRSLDDPGHRALIGQLLDRLLV